MNSNKNRGKARRCRARRPLEERTAGPALNLPRALAIACAALLLTVMLAPPPAGAASGLLGMETADYEILSADGGQLIGHNRYTVTPVAGGYVVKGEASYLSGAHDVETDRLERGGAGELPRLTEFQHQFFNPGGSHQLSIVADLLTGAVSCGRWRKGEPTVYDATLSMPTDTYAGASILLPLMRFVRSGDQGALGFHVLYCAPRPKVYLVTARTVVQKTAWPYYAGNPTEVTLKPDLGWFNLIASPFVPKTYLYFSDEHGMQFVGGDLERFYRGPKIKLVKIPLSDQQPAVAGSSDSAPARLSAHR